MSYVNSPLITYVDNAGIHQVWNIAGSTQATQLLTTVQELLAKYSIMRSTDLSLGKVDETLADQINWLLIFYRMLATGLTQDQIQSISNNLTLQFGV